MGDVDAPAPATVPAPALPCLACEMDLLFSAVYHPGAADAVGGVDGICWGGLREGGAAGAAGARDAPTGRAGETVRGAPVPVAPARLLQAWRARRAALGLGGGDGGLGAAAEQHDAHEAQLDLLSGLEGARWPPPRCAVARSSDDGGGGGASGGYWGDSVDLGLGGGLGPFPAFDLSGRASLPVAAPSSVDATPLGGEKKRPRTSDDGRGGGGWSRARDRPEGVGAGAAYGGLPGGARSAEVPGGAQSLDRGDDHDGWTGPPVTALPAPAGTPAGDPAWARDTGPYPLAEGGVSVVPPTAAAAALDRAGGPWTTVALHATDPDPVNQDLASPGANPPDSAGPADPSSPYPPTCFADRVFGGEMLTEVACHGCGHASVSVQGFLDLSLDLGGDAHARHSRGHGVRVPGRGPTAEATREDAKAVKREAARSARPERERRAVAGPRAGKCGRCRPCLHPHLKQACQRPRPPPPVRATAAALASLFALGGGGDGEDDGGGEAREATAAPAEPAVPEPKKEEPAPPPAAPVPPPPAPAQPPISLDRCLGRLVEPETLGATEPWTCGACGVRGLATRRVSLWRLPPVLCLHLKRFHVARGKGGGGWGAERSDVVDRAGGCGGGAPRPGPGRASKLDNHVVFPLRLDLAPLTTPRVAAAALAEGRGGRPRYPLTPDGMPAPALAPTGRSGSAPDRLVRPAPTTNDDGWVYRLYAVVCHSGDLGGGHYVSFVQRGGRWYRLDDAWSVEVDVATVLACKAYLLYYRHVGLG